MKSNKSISRIIFYDQIPFFAISKIDKNLFLKWENCQKCNFTKIKFDLFDFTSFLAGTFLNFLFHGAALVRFCQYLNYAVFGCVFIKKVILDSAIFTFGPIVRTIRGLVTIRIHTMLNQCGLVNSAY